MSETTTIAITKAQKDRLDTLKLAESESYKDVLTRLMDGFEANTIPEDRAKEILLEQVEAKLDKIEQSSLTIEERTGSIQRQLEDMGGR